MLFLDPALKPLSIEQYHQLTQHCETIKTSRNRPVILISKTGTIIKHIYHRSGWSSSRIWPYALRFLKNSQLLKPLGFTVPQVHSTYRCHALRCDIITYSRLDGRSVRALWLKGQKEALFRTPAFIAKLHQEGIYFRDLHLDNLLYHNNAFGMIDLASIQKKKKPLSVSMRQRNFQHLFSKEEDQGIFAQYTPEQFLSTYQVTAQLSETDYARLRAKFITESNRALDSRE